MHGIVHAVKVALLPGSLPFLLLALVAGVAALWRPRWRGVARWWLAVVVIGYWLMSLPIGARALVRVMTVGIAPLRSGAEAAGATAIVVLDGGTSRFVVDGRVIETVNRPSAFRALEAARVYRLLDRPWVIVSGGTDRPARGARPEAALLRDELLRAGIPADRVIVDSGSQDTRESAVNVEKLLRPRQVSAVVLVTSATHIRRAALALSTSGLRVVPSPSAEFGETDSAWLGGWWPTPTALQVSEDALRDCLATIYYFARGWLSAPSRARS